MVVAVAASGALVWWTASKSRVQTEHRLSSVSKAQTADPASPVTPELATDPSIEESSTLGRSSVSWALLGSVTSTEGAAIEHATISWMPHESIVHATRAAIAAANEVARLAFVTETDASGRFAFRESPISNDRAGLAWVTHPDFEARALSTAAGEPINDLRCTLTPRRGFTVRVLDEHGAPVVGATVEHTGVIDSAQPSVDLADAARRCRFFREQATDQAGTARLSAMHGLQGIVAKRGSQTTPRVEILDPFGRDLELRFGSTYALRGRVEFESGRSNGSAMSVRVCALSGKRTDSGTWIDVRDDLSFGPVTLPCSTAAEIRLELLGGGVIPALENRRAPAADEIIDVVLKAHGGFPQYVRVIDAETESPIGGARVSVSSLLNSADWRHAYSTSDEQGLAVVEGCTSATGVLAATARGFTRATHGPFELGEPIENDPWVLRMQRAGRLEGRVMHAGKPVEDFELVFWRDSPYPVQARNFFRRVDGRFELDEVPLGGITLVASSVDLPCTDPRRIKIEPDQSNSVEIELPAGNFARGRVVDARDGVGLSTAKIQLWSHWGATMLSKRGSALPVASDGQFELRGLGPGEVHFMVEAPGYANWLEAATVTPGSTLDLGLISLVRRQSLTVRARLPRDADATEYSVTLRSLEYHPARHLDPTGNIVFPDVAPGSCHVSMLAPDGSRANAQAALVAGQQWLVELELTGAAQFEVRLRKRDGSAWDDDCFVHCLTARHSAVGDCVERLTEDSVARFSALPVGDCLVRISDEGGNSLANERVQLQPGDNSFVVELPRRSARIELVDREGAPIAGADTAICAPGASAAWTARGTSDEHGIFIVPESPFDTHVLTAFEATHGLMMNVAIELEYETAAPQRVLFDAPGRVRVACRDRGFVPPGLQLRVGDPNDLHSKKPLSCEADGTISYGPVSLSDFAVELVHPGYWPTRQVVRATTADSAETIQVRRLGSVTLHVRGAESGQAIVGAEVGLNSIEFDTDVATWLAAGKVGAFSATLTTDANGVLRVDGLPNGEYRWQVGEATGSVVVPPHANVALDVGVP